MATPPDFTAGAVLTAAQMNQLGLFLVTSYTVGSGVSSVVMPEVFSADFDNYRIIFSGGVGSANNAQLNLQLGAVNSGYYIAGWFVAYAGGTGVINQNGTTSWFCGFSDTTGNNFVWDILQPFNAVRTVLSLVSPAIATNRGSAILAGYQNSTTSFEDFTITPDTGTLTGGTISVYGYRK
jgi:hypothetical protein